MRWDATVCEGGLEPGAQVTFSVPVRDVQDFGLAAMDGVLVSPERGGYWLARQSVTGVAYLVHESQLRVR